MNSKLDATLGAGYFYISGAYDIIPSAFMELVLLIVSFYEVFFL